MTTNTNTNVRRLTGNQCFCRVCGRLFSTVRNFERHRRGGVCLHPESVGLLQVEGLWKRAGIATSAALTGSYAASLGSRP